MSRNFNRNGVTTGATAVTVVPGSDPVATRLSFRLLALNVLNVDTNDAEVIVQYNDDSTIRELQRVNLVARASATGTLTFSGIAVENNTVTIDGKVYTFNAVLGSDDGDVLIGANAAAGVLNLVRAIMLGAGSGSLYAAATTLHNSVTAVDGAGDTVVVTAKAAGAAGNTIDTAQTLGSGTWADTTLLGGVDPGALAFSSAVALDTSTRSLEIKLGWPAATTELDWVSSYARDG